MKRANRLTNGASFSYVYKNGQVCSAKGLTLHCVPATSVKVGISVSKKIGKSVVRSKVKRRVKESFRRIIPNLLVKCNYVVTAREGIAEMDYKAIDEQLKFVLKRFKHISG